MDGGDTYRGVAAISNANEAATRRALEPFLEPGDQIEVQAGVRPKDGKWSTMWGPRLEVTPAAVELPELIGVGVTLTRVIIVRQPMAPEEESALLYSVPLTAVADIEIMKVKGAKEVRWTAEGRQFSLSSNGSFVKQVAAALQL